jgi:hypothetical protein
MPEGSGFGLSSARLDVASAIATPAASSMARIKPDANRDTDGDDNNGRRSARLSGCFIMGLLLFFCGRTFSPKTAALRKGGV